MSQVIDQAASSKYGAAAARMCAASLDRPDELAIPAEASLGLPHHRCEAPMNTTTLTEAEYHEALRQCLEGKFSEELRVLYQTPNRDRVPWVLFPSWAHPNDPVEGGHE